MSNTPTTDQPTVVRMKETRADYDLFAGQTYPHEGYDPENGWPILRIPMGLELAIDPDQCEVIEVTLTADLHVITERADGPDLDDLVRLIRYLREHRVEHNIRDAHTWEDGDYFDPARLTVVFGICAITDGMPLPDLRGLTAYFVGPDGTVYDCNGEAL